MNWVTDSPHPVTNIEVWSKHLIHKHIYDFALKNIVMESYCQLKNAIWNESRTGAMDPSNNQYYNFTTQMPRILVFLCWFHKSE